MCAVWRVLSPAVATPLEGNCVNCAVNVCLQ